MKKQVILIYDPIKKNLVQVCSVRDIKDEEISHLEEIAEANAVANCLEELKKQEAKETELKGCIKKLEAQVDGLKACIRHLLGWEQVQEDKLKLYLGVEESEEQPNEQN